MLLRRFAETDLDQSANWRFGTSFGEVYISVGRELPPSTPVEVNADVTDTLG